MYKALRFIAVIAVAAFLATSVSPLLASDFKEECLNQLGVLEKKIVGLAEAVPADKYTWRPAEGVRSVSEVYLHVAGANFGMPRMFGTPPPEGFSPRGYDTSITDKAEVTSKLKESFAHLRKAVEAVSASDADKPVKMFGREMTLRAVVWTVLGHLSEHLGQSIAYARMNGVTPPWSGGM